MVIPNQLKRKGFKFVLLRYKDKIPIEKEWQTIRNYDYDSPALLLHLETGNNYGIATGYGNLIVVDFDNKDIQDKLKDKMPPTFTVMTGRGLFHKYYITDKAETIKVMDNLGNTLIDVQGKGKQIVASGSTHPNGLKYEVVEDLPIADLSIGELKGILYPYLMDKIKSKSNLNMDEGIYNKDTIITELKAKIKISTLIKQAGIDTSINPTTCPLHESKRGKCLSFNDERGLWHCFHCLHGGDIIKWMVDVNHLDFRNARAELLRMAGMTVQEDISSIITAFVDHSDLARQFVQRQPLYYDTAKLWWKWDFNEFCWKIVDETDILNSIDSIISKGLILNTVESRIKNEILEGLRKAARQNKPFPANKNWIQFKDMIIDLETKQMFKAEPKYMITNPIPWNIGNDTKTPVMDCLFEQWVGKDYVKTLYQIIAYCLLPDYPIQRLFCLIGEGSNGKSTFQELLTRFIGMNNITSTELDNLLESRFEVTRLHKKLACIMGETNFNEMRRTSILKKLTGRDVIGFEYKNKNPFEDWNYAKIIISTNNLPTTADKSMGFYRRWIILDFPNKFTEKADILSMIPDEEFENLANRSIIELNELLDKRQFHGEGSNEEKAIRFEEKSNPLHKFLYDNTIEEVNGHIFKYELRNRLDDWCKINHFRMITDTELGIRMRNMGIETSRISTDWVVKSEDGYEQKKQYWAWIGIKWVVNNS